MILAAVCVLVVAQSSSEISEGFMNNPIFIADEIPILIWLSGSIHQFINVMLPVDL